ncbi:3-methyladenine DNA glycosylase [Nocardioides perillae]|uniref:3-methyladenine DNA glycosylase n=1 Tax=Nocardioides perillae TaxID=1119534 RepID=A0A7Y9RXL4_9ACTN|nr:hypothetical protein [Nocardioides perillae]
MTAEVRAAAGVLEPDAWRALADAHAARVDALVAPHLERRRSGVPHPVHDFLFTYYSQRPAQLRRWHPGFGTGLADAEEHGTLKGYAVRDGVAAVTAEHVRAQRPLLVALARLLRATASRAPAYSCFGLHEWAMVHRSAEHGTRHPWPLRLGADATDAVVESHRVTCSHFDAFRFFTPSARPLNTLSPGRDDRDAFEQPGCLHAGMDLYGKVAVRLSPMICSDLVADAFELAWDIRILDMRAAPYDMTGIRLDPTGDEWTPVKIETPEGKAEYVRLQREFSGRAAPIRQRLIEECERLLSATGV